MLGMCYILCKIDPMYYTLIWEQRGSGGWLTPPIREGCGGGDPQEIFLVRFWHFSESVFGGFSTHVFCSWFSNFG
jgi:hypothetical protein